ncbi:hypothetical protein ACFOVU_08220 [Nocardiopsis sediminis]|uniref:Uncharacterized protein n=1 Tax=Nocardiopsis sediminis TaxID=1778267 RepID=A0ABV8FMM8_9ACTN
MTGPRRSGAGTETALRARCLEQGAYWLLYVVSFGAAVVHWRAGNEALAVLCALAVVLAVRSIMSAHRRDQGRAGPGH